VPACPGSFRCDETGYPLTPGLQVNGCCRLCQVEERFLWGVTQHPVIYSSFPPHHCIKFCFVQLYLGSSFAQKCRVVSRLCLCVGAGLGLRS
jgi:hypothetical protein